MINLSWKEWTIFAYVDPWARRLICHKTMLLKINRLANQNLLLPQIQASSLAKKIATCFSSEALWDFWVNFETIFHWLQKAKFECSFISTRKSCCWVWACHQKMISSPFPYLFQKPLLIVFKNGPRHWRPEESAKQGRMFTRGDTIPCMEFNLSKYRAHGQIEFHFNVALWQRLHSLQFQLLFLEKFSTLSSDAKTV